jgi:ABC-type anion transport system duplicated permease subunit
VPNNTLPEDTKVFVRRIAYISLGTQAFLATLVIAFSAFQLNRCPVIEKELRDGEVDSASCPARALYSTMLTSTLAYFFPSPLNALVESTLLSRQPTERSGDRQPRKRRTKVSPKEEDEGLLK